MKKKSISFTGLILSYILGSDTKTFITKSETHYHFKKASLLFWTTGNTNEVYEYTLKTLNFNTDIYFTPKIIINISNPTHFFCLV